MGKVFFRVFVSGYKTRPLSGHTFFYDNKTRKWNLLFEGEKMRDIKNNEPNRYKYLRKYYD